MTRISSLIVALVLLSTVNGRATPPPSQHLHVFLGSVLLDDLKAAADECDPSVQAKTADVARRLSLPPDTVAPDTSCQILQANVAGDTQLEDIFSFTSPTVNGSRYQTIVVFDSSGERLGLYHEMNFPLTVDLAQRVDNVALSDIRLSGQGRWLGRDLSWTGLFRVENGRFVNIPDVSGKLAPPLRCPNTNPVKIEDANGITDNELRAVVCPDSMCALECVDKKNPLACHHRLASYWMGSFSQPDALEVLAAFNSPSDPPGLPRHGSYLYLLQATPCGWIKLGRVNNFVGSNDTCYQKRVSNRQLLVCVQSRGPFKGKVMQSTLGIYAVNGGALTVALPFHTEPLPQCNPGKLRSSIISDLSFDDAQDGILPLTVNIDAAQVSWSPDNGQTCSDAKDALVDSMKTYSIPLEISPNGARISPDTLERLRANPIPGLVLR